ncbi:sensor histidine kinase [Amycolatopsis sp. NPDC059021]|uniref:sensor histidine kinase n=1 Tax=Amycolatopsis sp. NPDC059021 TaxID=3346704 RepID=UPI003670B7C6
MRDDENLMRRVGRTPRWAVDVVVAVLVFLMMSLVGGGFREQPWRWFDVWAYLLTAGICLPLAARRWAPVPVLLVSSAAYLVYLSRDYLPGLHLWGPVLALYSLAAVTSLRTSIAGMLVTAPVLYAGAVALKIPPVAGIVQSLVVCGVAVLLGGLSRRLTERNRQLAEATDALRHEQDRRIERMMTEERLRIARELHDVIAHHLSVISMQAGLAGYVFDADPPTARAAVRTVGEVSRETLDDLRRVLNLLRVSPAGTMDADFASAPSLAQLPELVRRVETAGPVVELRTSGGLDDLPSGLQLTVYRVVQEALTNVLAHAGPCRVAVDVRREPHRLVATVSNDAPSAGSPTPGGVSGYGLPGMRERAKIFGGRVTAGPRPDGGFAVELVLPVS